MRLNGVSGDEGQVRSYIRGWAEEHADSVRTDALGNLIVFKRGRKAAENRLMLCATWTRWGSSSPGPPTRAF